MMLKVSGIPPEMSTQMLRMLIQDLCNLSYVMVEEFTQQSSSSGQSAIVACPSDQAGAKVLQKLHGKIIGKCKLIVEPWMTNDSTKKHGQTVLQEYESLFNSEEFRVRPPIYNFQDSGERFKKRKLCGHDEGIADFNINSPNKDGEPNPYRDNKCQQQDPSCGSNDLKQQDVHTLHESVMCDQPVAGVSSPLIKDPTHFQKSDGFPEALGHQKKIINVRDFREAAQGILNVLESITSQSVQKSSFIMQRTQTNKEIGLATEVTQATYQTANLFQDCQSTLKLTNDLNLLERAVSRILYILLNSRPTNSDSNSDEPNKVTNEAYGLIVNKLRNTIRDRIKYMQRLGLTSHSEKELCKFYFEKYRNDITGLLNKLEFANKTTLETAERKLLVEKMLIETPWLHPVGLYYSSNHERSKYQRRLYLDCASNLICLCVLKMPPIPTSNNSMKKLHRCDQIVFDYFKVDIFKKLDAFSESFKLRKWNWKNLAGSYLYDTGDIETDKSLKDARSYYERNSGEAYKGIFKDDMKPDFKIVTNDRIVKRFAFRITRDTIKQNKSLIDSMKRACESADRKKCEETLRKCIISIVTDRLKDVFEDVNTNKIVEEYWMRYPDTKHVCLMAEEQTKSGGNRNVTSEFDTFTNSIDEFLTDINEMVDVEGEAETTVTH